MDQPASSSSSSAAPLPVLATPTTLTQPGYSVLSASASHLQHVRLTNEGIKVQRNFYDNVTKNPTDLQCQSLLAVIRAMPGCGHHTDQRMKAWFEKQRYKERSAARLPSTGTASLPTKALCKRMFPSFEGPIIIKFLRELFYQYPDPPPELVTLWALQLEVQLEDVERWMKMENARETKPNLADLEASLAKHLPTPPSTASPEPSETESCPSSRTLRTLADAIAEARQQPPQDVPRVTSVAEFAECFAPFEAAFHKLNVTFQIGDFASSGTVTT